ncbi:MAG: hypothetical protein PVF43_16330 [Candidatus Eiseniibacteriota bacterium]|jgi:putative membrane protein
MDVTTDLSRDLSRADREAIRAAIAEAGAGSAGEIELRVVSSSADYDVAGWTGAALGALAAPLVCAFAFALFGLWPWSPALWIAMPPVVGALAGLLVTGALPGLRRLLVPDDLMRLAVDHGASVASIQRAVRANPQRPGILVFLSLFERRAVVVADPAVRERDAAGEFKSIEQSIAAGMRRGELGIAAAAGIRRAGELLEQHDVSRRADGEGGERSAPELDAPRPAEREEPAPGA